jgi:hypothetical protein
LSARLFSARLSSGWPTGPGAAAAAARSQHLVAAHDLCHFPVAVGAQCNLQQRRHRRPLRFREIAQPDPFPLEHRRRKVGPSNLLLAIVELELQFRSSRIVQRGEHGAGRVDDAGGGIRGTGRGRRGLGAALSGSKNRDEYSKTQEQNRRDSSELGHVRCSPYAGRAVAGRHHTTELHSRSIRSDNHATRLAGRDRTAGSPNVGPT